MSQVFPDIKIIKKIHDKPTSGELKVLDALSSLPNDYEIYFQSYLNGDRPDFVVVRKRGGILLIEVKDWDLTKYGIRDDWDWYLQKNQIKKLNLQSNK
jgi:hypothetical protein